MSKRSGKKGDVSATRSSPRKKPCPGRKGDDKDTEKNIWLDPDARSVDCGICFMPFEAEVFMCKNGHAACAKCCVRISRKCWCCGEPIGDVRCRPAENMLAEMYTVCKFSRYGCAEVVKYVEKRKHEETCPRAPYGCPVEGCSYRGMDLYAHLRDDGHADAVTSTAYLQATTVTLRKGTPVHALLLDSPSLSSSTDGVFLLLNGGGVLAGRSLSLARLGARPVGSREILYKIEVRGCEPGALSLAGAAPCVRLLEGFEPKKFLFVPDPDWGPSGSVSINIRLGWQGYSDAGLFR